MWLETVHNQPRVTEGGKCETFVINKLAESCAWNTDSRCMHINKVKKKRKSR